jgi:glyoxylase-like metal-dependent hydrolase (beta-lactamase superfamily II)
MAEKKVRIIPLDVGILGCDQSLMTLRRGMGKTVDLPFMAWYVEGLEKKVLIDTGPPSEERAQRLHKALNPRVSKEQETPQRLRQLGIQPEEIEIVILTHLHWDHVGQVDKFTKARIFVSQKEFDSAMSAPSPGRAGYETLLPGIEPVFMNSLSQFEFLDMAEEEILPGLKVFPTPGHTKGAISVEVMTSDGPYIAASDAVSTYDLLRGDPATHQRFLMPGIYVDMEATYNSIQRIYRRAQYDINRVIAGHDYEALNKGSFPAN